MRALWLTLALLAASPAHAGFKTEYFYCYRFPDGSGYCNGTMRGFRYSSDTRASAVFLEAATGARAFVATWSPAAGPTSITASCTAGTALASVWPKVMINDKYFDIQWDAAGVCTSLMIANVSAAEDLW